MAFQQPSADSQALLALRGELEREPGLSHSLVPEGSALEPALFGDFVAAGPRATESGEYAIVIEAIREGYLLHYREPRLFAVGTDPDLALLAGDFLYALGLERLSKLGDIEAVAQLADLISLQAVIHADGPVAGSDLDLLDRSLWLATSVAVACGADAEIERLKGEIPAPKNAFDLAGLLLEWADARVGRAGVGEAWAQVREQVGFSTEAQT